MAIKFFEFHVDLGMSDECEQKDECGPERVDSLERQANEIMYHVAQLLRASGLEVDVHYQGQSEED